MARAAGGRSWVVETAQELAQVWGEIDRLERGRVEAPRFLVHRELFAFLALGALFLVTLAWVMEETFLRRIP
jgi:hypothetical protein